MHENTVNTQYIDVLLTQILTKYTLSFISPDDDNLTTFIFVVLNSILCYTGLHYMESLPHNPCAFSSLSWWGVVDMDGVGWLQRHLRGRISSKDPYLWRPFFRWSAMRRRCGGAGYLCGGAMSRWGYLLQIHWDNGLAPRRRQTFMWISDGLVFYWNR